jgi:hypothetical protein
MAGERVIVIVHFPAQHDPARGGGVVEVAEGVSGTDNIVDRFARRVIIHIAHDMSCGPVAVGPAPFATGAGRLSRGATPFSLLPSRADVRSVLCMTNESTIAAPQPTTDVAARFQLDQVMAMVGVDGLVEALKTPGLLAEIDQHAAAVRNSIEAGDQRVGAISLARYARSVLAVHQRHNRPAPTPETVDWNSTDWTVLRLVAVCAMAEETDCL